MLFATPLVRRTRSSGDDNLIPLINIVFLLLIFFMVAGHIEASQQSVDLPDSDAGVRRQQANLLVEIQDDGRLFLDHSPVEIEELATLIRHAGQGEASSVVVRADRALIAEQLAPVLRQIAASGAGTVSLAVSASEGGR